jgi:hypothetical protein
MSHLLKFGKERRTASNLLANQLPPKCVAFLPWSHADTIIKEAWRSLYKGCKGKAWKRNGRSAMKANKFPLFRLHKQAFGKSMRNIGWFEIWVRGKLTRGVSGKCREQCYVMSNGCGPMMLRSMLAVAVDNERRRVAEAVSPRSSWIHQTEWDCREDVVYMTIRDPCVINIDFQLRGFNRTPWLA